MRRKRPFAVVVCAHPVWNVPPLFNVAQQLGESGRATIVVGYRDGALPATQRIGRGARVLRVPLLCRAVRIPALRRVLSSLEFLLRARSVGVRVAPRCLIAVNDPSVILLRFLPAAIKKVAWLLEYPEFERMGFVQRGIMNWSSRFWAAGDIFVAPTAQRLALHQGLRPRLLARRSVVVHNTPSRKPLALTAESPHTVAAKRWAESIRAQGLLLIIHAGAVGNRYGIDAAIGAVSAVEGVALLIVGPYHPEAARDFDKAMLSSDSPERVRWMKEIPYPELQGLLNLCDIGFVHYIGDCLNTRFSAPGKLYEYLRAGLVILTDSDACIAAELATAGCAVFFESPVNSAGVADALRKLIARRERLEEMQNFAAELFKQRFCIEVQLKSLVHYIEEGMAT